MRYGRGIATDPLENWRRNQEMLRKALEGPLQQLLKSQEAARRALEGPIADALRAQQATVTAMAPAIERQRLAQEALDSPLRRMVEASEKTRHLLEGPLEKIARNQAAIQSALAGPYAAVEASQRAMRAVMVEAAATADEGVEAESEDTEWLAQWTDAVAEWRPTRQEAQDFLNNLAFLLGLVLFSMTAGGSFHEDLLGVLALLAGAGAIVLRHTGDGDDGS